MRKLGSMKILLAPNAYWPMKSGVPVFVRQLAKSFVTRGHRVLIVTPQQTRNDSSFEIIDGIEVYRMPFVFPWRLFWQGPQERFLPFFRHCFGDMFALIQLLAREKIDLVNIHSLTGPHVPYLLLAQLFRKCPTVVTLHGFEFFRLDTWCNKVRALLLRHSLENANQIVAISAHLASEIVRFCPKVRKKIVTIHNGVASREFYGVRGFSFPSRYLLSLGRLNPVKGHDVLLMALRKVADEEKNVHLIIAGDGPQRARLHAVTMALSLTGHVTFLGEISRERAKDLLAGCEFLVLSSWHEGMPLVALEAMASGKPVIATKVGGISEIVTESETGLLVAPGDPGALAEAIIFLLRNPDRCKAMGERGRNLVELHYDFEQMADRYLKVYQKALQKGGQRDGKAGPEASDFVGENTVRPR